MVTAQSQNLHKQPQKRIVSSHQSVGRWFIFCVFCSKNILMEPVGHQQPTCLCVKMEFVVGTSGVAAIWIFWIYPGATESEGAAKFGLN